MTTPHQNAAKGWRNNGILATVILLLLLAAMALVAWFVPAGRNFLVLLVLLVAYTRQIVVRNTTSAVRSGSEHLRTRRGFGRATRLA